MQEHNPTKATPSQNKRERKKKYSRNVSGIKGVASYSMLVHSSRMDGDGNPVRNCIVVLIYVPRYAFAEIIKCYKLFFLNR